MSIPGEQADRPAGRFAWLFAPAPSLPPAPDRAEFEEACRLMLESWQVLPVVAPLLLKWGSRHGDSPMAQRVQDRLIGLQMLGIVQVKLVHRVAAALAERGIPHVMLKSSALRFTVYDDPVLRPGKDIDLGVARPRIYDAEAVARELGFHPAQWDHATRRFSIADDRLRKRVESEHYELGFLARRQVVRDMPEEAVAAIRRDLSHQIIWHADGEDLSCYVTLDVHHGLCLDVPVEPVLETAYPLAPGSPLQLPSPEWVVFHLIFKLYWEGVHNYGQGVYQYADLVRLFPRLDDGRFGALTDLLSRYNLEAAGYYVLRRLGSDLGLAPSPALSGFLRRMGRAGPEESPIARNDLGDMWAKLWGSR